MVCFLVIPDKLAPKGFLGKFLRIGTTFRNLCLRKGRVGGNGILDVVGYIAIVVIGAVDNLDAIFYLAASSLDTICPQAETSEVGRNARHLEAVASRGVYPQGS